MQYSDLNKLFFLSKYQIRVLNEHFKILLRIYIFFIFYFNG